MPKLYVVSTPIGNLEDLSPRAVRVLREVGLIAAEDTRTTRRLLSSCGIRTPLVSYHEQGAKSKAGSILERLESVDVALVSEAGTPTLSDPGYALVRSALANGIEVVAVPGPSAITAALAVSGLPSDQFIYVGFLPRKKTERRKFLTGVANEPRTIVAFEAPHRLRASLSDIQYTLGDREIAVCREMTKVHEEVLRGTVSEALAHFEEPIGESTLVIAGRPASESTAPLTEDAAAELRKLRQEGLSAKEAIARVSALTGASRRDLYRAWLE